MSTRKKLFTKLTHKIVLMPMIVTPMTINCVVDEPIPSFKYEVADFYTRGRQIYPNRRTKKKTRVGRFVASKVRLLSLCYTVHGVHMSVNLMLVYGKKNSDGFDTTETWVFFFSVVVTNFFHSHRNFSVDMLSTPNKNFGCLIRH